MLETLLVQFSHYLRENGLEVPPSNVQDAIRLLPYLDITNRFMFQESLKQIWIHDSSCYEKYDLCFYEFFYIQIQDVLTRIEYQKKIEDFQKKQEKKQRQKEQMMEKIEKKSVSKPKGEGEKEEKETSQAKEWMKEKLKHRNHLISSLLLSVLEEEIKELAQNKQSIMESVSPSDIQEEMEALMWDALCENQSKIVFDQINYVGNFLSSLRADLLKVKNLSKENAFSPPKTEQRGMRKVIQTEIDQLKERKIEQLHVHEIKKLRHHIEEHAVHFLTKIGRVLRKSNQSEELDMRKMISESLQTFGVPIHLYYRKPKVTKTKIDILLDVSGSVIKSAEFLSLFAYLIHQHFPGQVRSFVFVGKLAEVTDFYHLDEPELAVQYSLMKAPIDYKGYSNYDLAFKTYEEQYMESVDKNTIVMFLGDARNNRNDARVSLIQTLQEKSKKIYWFNPESKGKWNQGDSVIGKYQPYCTGVFETTTLKQLEDSLSSLTEQLA